MDTDDENNGKNKGSNSAVVIKVLVLSTILFVGFGVKSNLHRHPNEDILWSTTTTRTQLHHIDKEDEPSILAAEMEEEEEGEQVLFVNHNHLGFDNVDANSITKVPVMTNETKRPIYFCKIPKTGGTTISVTFQRYAIEFGLKQGSTGNTALLRTCMGSDKASAWEKMVRRNDGKIGIFVSHACFIPEMQLARFYEPETRPLSITLLREPWSRFISAYRYTRKCCTKMNPPKSWCANKCSWNTPAIYADNYCNSQGCNVMKHFLGPGANVLHNFDLVLTIERFDEGLVLLHILFGFPWHLMPYVTANENNDIPMPEYSESFKERTLQKYMKDDVELYKDANKRLDAHIANLTPAEKKYFDERVILLKSQSKRAANDCKYRRGSDCLNPKNSPYLKHAAGCYTKCLEASLKNEKLPPVPLCASKSCKDGIFRVGCMKCKCNSDQETAICREDMDHCILGNDRCIEENLVT